MALAYRLALPRRIANALVAALIRLGVGPRDAFLLTTVGRRSGRRYTAPVILVPHAGERWLVAPYGERQWVRNARAAGWVELRRGRSVRRVDVVELPAADRPPILHAYVRAVPITRKFFTVACNAPPEAFAAEAGRHPVFRLSPPFASG